MGPEANNQGIRSLKERRLNPERRMGTAPRAQRAKGDQNAKPEPKPKWCLLWQIGKLGLEVWMRIRQKPKAERPERWRLSSC